MKYRKYILIAVVLIVVVWIAVDNILVSKSSNKAKKDDASAEYVGDLTCKSCHQQEYKLWEESHHFMAMQPPNDSTVKGDFNNATFTADGVTSRFFKKGDKFYINTEGPDGSYHDYEVAYTYGFTPLQQYLIKFPGGRYQVPRTSWDTKKKRWFHQYKGDKIPAGDWLHWTGGAQNWNTTCADCHSTNLKKNYFVEQDSFHTTYSSINVSCEACHGPASNHLEYINTIYKKGEREAGSRLDLPKDAGQIAQITACTPCHARRTTVNNNLVHSKELLDNYIPEIPISEAFHDDGQVLDEDFIYTSFAQSKMFTLGVKCSDCHNPHSTQLVLKANNVCFQCHQKTYEEPSHTFHAANSTGSQCVNCHMPGDYFMGNDFRHDHSLRVPRPDLSVQYGTPNACNMCHTDKSPEWATKAVEKWYGKTRDYHFAEDLIPGSRGGVGAEAHLVKLINKADIPAIVIAAAAYHLGNVPGRAGLNALLSCLKHKDAQVRYRTLISLKSFPQDQWLNEAMPLLQDPIRAVRVAAADLFLTVSDAAIPSSFQSPFVSAKSEYMQFLFSQADFAAGNLSLGDYYARQGDYVNAEKFYLRGLKKDNLMNLARINLATVYSIDHNNEAALKVLKEADKLDPTNETILFNLGLLYHEMNDSKNAMLSFDKAVKLKALNPRVYYNYGLLLLKTNVKKAEEVLKKGLQVSKDNPDLHYALAFLYLQEKEPAKAMKHALILKKLSPNNPSYASIFSALNI